MKSFLAFDLGASSGRAILGGIENGRLVLKEVHRFPNNGRVVNGDLRWDINGLRDEQRFVFTYTVGDEKRERSISAEGPIEACTRLMKEEGFDVELVSYKQGVVGEGDTLWNGRALSEIVFRNGEKTVTGRGVHNDTLVANMKAVFGAVNMLFFRE